ncbi:hypothetical protein C8R45DRAFT_1011607 [Mycena sanguinolenta]|nr:hypothetical protein C8R45DRAFT_1011607 [Mycena sanguinolenta]
MSSPHPRSFATTAACDQNTAELNEMLNSLHSGAASAGDVMHATFSANLTESLRNLLPTQPQLANVIAQPDTTRAQLTELQFLRTQITEEYYSTDTMIAVAKAASAAAIRAMTEYMLGTTEDYAEAMASMAKKIVQAQLEHELARQKTVFEIQLRRAERKILEMMKRAEEAEERASVLECDLQVAQLRLIMAAHKDLGVGRKREFEAVGRGSRRSS